MLNPAPTVTLDHVHQTAIVRDGTGNLELSLNYKKGCVIDHLKVRGQETLNTKKGCWSGVQSEGRWFTTATLAKPPTVVKKGDQLRITGIDYGPEGTPIVEVWTLTAKTDSMTWKIDRTYLRSGTLEAIAMPSIPFQSMSTWTGALLGTGGIAWGKLLDLPNATYGVHTGSATFWNASTDASLRFSTLHTNQSVALNFSREPDDSFTLASAITHTPMLPKYGLSRFQRTRQDVWKPFTVEAGQTSSATYELKAADYQKTFRRGDFKGLDTAAITELSNTIGRIGVIDNDLVGSNGWYSGYICMHEPWLARVGTALDDPNYTQSCARFLDYAREHAIQPDGMVKSRWKYDAGDAQPGTYDPANGFYEAQWGRLMDSQSSYVTNVADQFDQSGDLTWVKRQKSACESALDYLLRRDSDHDGLVEMQNSLTSQHRSSDWLDIVWASHENAFVNAQLYGALLKWATVEEVLCDAPRAAQYRGFAKQLKTSFNKSIGQGGFWDDKKGWYVYWRDADGTVHGDNLVVPVNLTAVAEGICEDPKRQILLDNMEKRMEAENLLSWPACFESYAPGEGANDVFPTYENGDVFLAWAEYGINAYASYKPDLALKYLRRIVAQYKKDGLAFQRYLRKTGQGAGDDILANNCNALTGLYRDIFGIQPKYNRLYLEPHLTPDLDGTRVDYLFRGQRLEVNLSTKLYSIQNGNVSVRSSRPFGAAFEPGNVTFFPGDQSTAALSVHGTAKSHLTLTVHDWSANKHWSVQSLTKQETLTQTFHALQPGIQYSLVSNGKTLATVSTEKPTVKLTLKANETREFELHESS